jgi:hypothetical protein
MSVVPINKYGAILRWPKGMCDTNLHLSSEIMSNAMKKRKKESK